MGFLAGKRLLITGVISNRSIAYGIAAACKREGAEIAFTYQNDRIKERVTEFAKEFDSSLVFPCDVGSDEQIDALFAEGTDAGRVLADTAQAIGAPMPSHETHEVADQDWVRATQSQFGPIAIGEGFWIVPSWCDLPEPGAIALELDPGLAFGTGSHPTTRLCLEWLRGAIAGGETVLDYGCGSGILAIAAAKLGARTVAGTDVDAQALAASAANARANGVEATFVMPDRLAPGERDVVVANILANPLILLAPALAARTKRGGHIALSGIREAQADEVAAAYARWFTLAVWRRLDGWVLLAGTRHANG